MSLDSAMQGQFIFGGATADYTSTSTEGDEAAVQPSVVFIGGVENPAGRIGQRL